VLNLEAALFCRQVNVPAPIDLGNGTVIGRPRVFREVSEDDVVFLLSRDDFVSVAIAILYSRQCADERAGRYTRHDNGIGFNKFDAARGACYGEWVLGASVRYKDRTPSFMLGGQRFFLLSGKHLVAARQMLHKYRKQLASAINAM
jgi:hypothetical protein